MQLCQVHRSFAQIRYVKVYVVCAVPGDESDLGHYGCHHVKDFEAATDIRVVSVDCCDPFLRSVDRLL